MARTPGFHPGNLSSILGGATIERKEKMNLIWFYLHCFAVVVILWADATDRLEPVFNAFEQKMGLYTPTDTLDYTPPYYIPPQEAIEADSNLVKK